MFLGERRLNSSYHKEKWRNKKNVEIHAFVANIIRLEVFLLPFGPIFEKHDLVACKASF